MLVFSAINFTWSLDPINLCMIFTETTLCGHKRVDYLGSYLLLLVVTKTSLLANALALTNETYAEILKFIVVDLTAHGLSRP